MKKHPSVLNLSMMIFLVSTCVKKAGETFNNLDFDQAISEIQTMEESQELFKSTLEVVFLKRFCANHFKKVAR